MGVNGKAHHAAHGTATIEPVNGEMAKTEDEVTSLLERAEQENSAWFRELAARRKRNPEIYGKAGDERLA